MSTVVQVVQHMRPGGIETMALDLSAFSKKYEKTIIISLEGSRESSIKSWPRLKGIADNIIFLDKKPGLQPSLIFHLTRLFKQLKVDTVHSHHIGPLLYAGIAARLAGSKCLIHTEHDAWHLNNPRRRRLQQFIIKLTRPTLVADAEIVAAKMKHYLKINNIHIIHNGIDTERFIPGDQTQARYNLGLPQNVQLIGCSGRLEKVKGQKTLIYALTKLPETVHLSLAGIGSTETELRRIINVYNLSRRVHFLGRIDDMPEFYRALDVFCLPSLNEGYPLSPLEAQSCDIPTVVTNVGGSSETLCPHNGKLIPANNPQAMADTLLRMLQLKLEKTHTSSRSFVQKRGDVRQMAHAYSLLKPVAC